MNRQNSINWFLGFWLGVEAVIRVPALKSMACGWKLLSVFGLALGTNCLLNVYNSYYAGPVISAFIKRHGEHAKNDMFEIKDRKREFFEIDTSQYMNYDFQDLGHEYHAHHGPQPDGEAKDSTWLVEMDKFLKGEHNHFKEHRNFINYDFKYKNKDYPSVQDAHNLFNNK
mmetsp:Transcript_35995/g.26739  ORF Transcript_35995/g.26739 Transcript_35995/m.26739 type:complete len:170 (+) Transcript_35995:191-700(+)